MSKLSKYSGYYVVDKDSFVILQTKDNFGGGGREVDLFFQPNIGGEPLHVRCTDAKISEDADGITLTTSKGQFTFQQEQGNELSQF